MSQAQHPRHRYLQDMDHLGFYRALSQQGDIVPFNSAKETGFLINHPKYVEQILASRESNYQHPAHPYEVLRPYLTHLGLFCLRLKSDQADGHAQFTQLLDLASNHMQQWMTRLPLSGQPPIPVELSHFFKQCFLHLVMVTLFDVADTQELEAFVEASLFIESCVANQTDFTPEMLPELMRQPFAAAKQAQIQLAQSILSQRMHDNRHDPANIPCIVAIIRTLLNGYNALAGGLGWACHLLAEHAGVLTVLQSEIDRVLMDAQTIEHQTLQQLRYTRMVLSETLRLYPPAWLLGRRALAADTLGPHAIPAGAKISVCPYTSQRHPDFWAQPNSFRPDHFTPEESASRPNYAWFPFGGGERLCPSSHIAMPILQITLALLVKNFQWKSSPYHPVVPKGRISLRPEPGITVLLQRRPGC